MVFVKVRETYDLHTIKDKMSVIGIHTPGAGIIKRNYPGLLMQCKGYRPVSCDIRLACASMQPLSVQEVGLDSGDVAPEDVFNPILYKAVSNWSMSQIESLIHTSGLSSGGDSVNYVNSGVMPLADDFDLYYGLLAQTEEWKHANPQAGLEMRGLIPYVYETYQNIGQNDVTGADSGVDYVAPSSNFQNNISIQTFRGRSHPLPMLNCTAPVGTSTELPATSSQSGFGSESPYNFQLGVPAPKVFCGLIIVPPSRLHTLFYRLVCEWTLEFSKIRPLGDIISYQGLAGIGSAQHIMSYTYESKLLKEDTCMVDTTEGSDIKKVM